MSVDLEQTPRRSRDYQRFLNHQLGQAQSRIKAVDIVTGIIICLVGGVAYALSVTMLDQIFVLSTATRIALLAIFASFTLAYVVYAVVLPSVRRINLLYAAHQVEIADPTTKNSLVNWLQLRDRDDEIPESIMQAIEVRAATDLRRIDLGEAIQTTHILRASYVLAAVVVAFCLFLFSTTKELTPSLRRVLFPLAEIAPPTETKLTQIEPGSTEIAAGDKVTVSAYTSGKEPASIMLYVTADEGEYWEPIPLTPPAERFGQWQVTLNDRQKSFEYYLVANDFTSGHFFVTVTAAPMVSEWGVTYFFPAYTSQPKRTDAGGDIDALEGTEVEVQVTTNVPVKEGSGRLELQLAKERNTVNLTKVAGTENKLTGKFRLTTDGNYQVDFQDLLGRRPQFRPIKNIRVRKDLVPVLGFIEPKDPEIQQPPSGSFSIRLSASDDYGLDRVHLTIQRQGDRKILFDEDLGPRNEPIGRSKIFEVPVSLGPYDLKPGDLLVYWAEGQDSKRPVSNEISTRNDLRTIQIVEPPKEQPAQENPQQQQEGAKQPEDQPPKDQTQKDQPDQKPEQGQQGEQKDQQKQDGSQGQGEQQQDSSGAGAQGTTKQTENGKGESGQADPNRKENDSSERPSGDPQSKDGPEKAEPKEPSKEGTNPEGDSSKQDSSDQRDSNGSKDDMSNEDKESLDKLKDFFNKKKQEKSQPDPQKQKPNTAPSQPKNQESSQSEKDESAEKKSSSPKEDRQGAEKTAPAKSEDEKPSSATKSGNDEKSAEEKSKEESVNGSKEAGNSGKEKEEKSQKPGGDVEKKSAAGEKSKDSTEGKDKVPSKADKAGSEEKMAPQKENEKSNPVEKAEPSDPGKAADPKQGSEKEAKPDDKQPLEKKDEAQGEGESEGAKPKDSQEKTRSGDLQKYGEAGSQKPEETGGKKNEGGARQQGKQEGADEKGASASENGEKKGKQPSGEKQESGKQGEKSGESKPGEKQSQGSQEGNAAEKDQGKESGQSRPNQPTPESKEQPEEKENAKGSKKQGDQNSAATEKAKSEGESSQGESSESGESSSGSPSEKQGESQSAGDKQQGQGKSQGEGNKEQGNESSTSGKQGKESSGESSGQKEQQGQSDEKAGSQNGQGGESSPQKESGKGGRGDQPGESQSEDGSEGSPESGQNNKQPPGAKGRDRMPEGNNEQSQSEPPPPADNGLDNSGEKASDEDLKEGGDLVLRKLQEELKKKQVDPDLLKDLGWTEEDARKFADRLKDDPIPKEKPADPMVGKGREGFGGDSQLRKSSARSAGQLGNDAQQDLFDARRAPPPPEYRELFEAYTRSLSKTAAPPPASKGQPAKPGTPK